MILPYACDARDRDAPTRERLRAHARDRGRTAALVAGDRTIDYAELAAEVDRLAAALAFRGVGPGETVAIALRDEVEHLLATLALLVSGALQVALPSRESAESRARLAARAGATVALVDGDLAAPPGLRRLAFADLRGGAGAQPAPADADAPALLLTGSGTTGEAKLVAFSDRDLARHASRAFDHVGERTLRPAHVEFNNSKRLRLYALWQGGTTLFVDGSAAPLARQCERLAATRLELGVAHATNLVADAAAGPLPPALDVRVGGSRMPWTLRRRFLERVSPNLHVSYGTTETSVVSLALPGEHDARESVGRPQPGVEVEVIDASGGRVPPYTAGSIRLRGPGMAHGYVGDAAATARCFVGGWFEPGDSVSIGADGALVVHGRSDDMMIMNGVNIFPLEIERVLESHPAVGAAAALPLASSAHGQIPVAAVELRPGSGTCTAGDLLRFARQSLGLRAPRRVLVLDALPRNAAGKILRRDIAPAFDVAGRSHG